MAKKLRGRRVRDAWPPSLRRRIVEVLLSVYDIATQKSVDPEQLVQLAKELVI
jgi:hypothetical protein